MSQEQHNTDTKSKRVPCPFVIVTDITRDLPIKDGACLRLSIQIRSTISLPAHRVAKFFNQRNFHLILEDWCQNEVEFGSRVVITKADGSEVAPMVVEILGSLTGHVMKYSAELSRRLYEELHAAYGYVPTVAQVQDYIRTAEAEAQ